MKTNRKRMQKEEEMEKQTTLNAVAVKNGNCIVVNLLFDTNTLIEDFMAMVSTQCKWKKKQAKKRKIFAHFS
jgi:hypothetical protein